MFVSLTMKKRAVTLLMFRVNTVVFGLEILRLSSSRTTHMEELEGEGFYHDKFRQFFCEYKKDFKSKWMKILVSYSFNKNVPLYFRRFNFITILQVGI